MQGSDFEEGLEGLVVEDLLLDDGRALEMEQLRELRTAGRDSSRGMCQQKKTQGLMDAAAGVKPEVPMRTGMRWADSETGQHVPVEKEIEAPSLEQYQQGQPSTILTGSVHEDQPRRMSSSVPSSRIKGVSPVRETVHGVDAPMAIQGKTRKKFNAGKALARLGPDIKTLLKQEVTIVTLNIGGLRSPYKLESLKEMAHQVQFGIAIITETHMLNEEMEALKIPGYEVIHKQGTNKQLGGVMIIAAPQMSCKKIEDGPTLPAPIDACSCLVYPTHETGYTICLTGIYVPPSAEATPQMLMPLVAPQKFLQTAATPNPTHLVVGDLNPNSWKRKDCDLYHEWINEAGFIELSHPEHPTYKTGSILDKFLLYPGDYTPDEWLGPQGQYIEPRDHHIIDLSDEYYPARTFPEPWIDDHHPVLLSFRGAENPAPSTTEQKVRIKVRDLTQEEWESKHVGMQEFLLANASRLHNCAQANNLARYFDVIVGGIRNVFGTRSRKGKQCVRCTEGLEEDQKSEEAPSSPFHLFCLRHKTHPEYSLLMKAVVDKDKALASEVMCRMVRDGWRSYLSTVRPSDTSAFFLYLARLEDRKPRKNRYPCRAPLMDQNGERHFKGQEKCNILADFFAAKLQDSALAMSTGDMEVSRWRRLCQTREFEPVLEVEVKKAIAMMARKKAAGDDGLVAELFQNLPCLLRPVTSLFNMILQQGRLPYQMLRVVMIPLDKPHRDPEQCRSKRPISLISVLSKALEAVVLHRILGRLEGGLDPGQYAYRRERGTEMHLLEFHDFVRESRGAGNFTYITSVDVAAAFDNVPHRCLINTAGRLGVDPYLCRYMDVWLKRRVFRMRLMTSMGKYHSGWKRISKGVPQGGILSPFLWLLHINPFADQVKARLRRKWGDEVVRKLCILLYADDIMCAFAHENCGLLVEIVRDLADISREVLAILGLNSDAEKSEGFLLGPASEDGSLFRRHPRHCQAEELTACTPAQPQTWKTDMENLQGRPRGKCAFPYKNTESFRLLGVTFDNKFSFGAQLERVLSLSKKRLAIMGKVAGFAWGLETNMLRLTGDTLITSLLRYGLAVVGSGLSDEAMRRVNTCVLNVMARKIVGVNRTARVPILHAVSGILSIHNLFIQHCASMLDLSLRASNSTIQTRLHNWLCQVFKISAWEPGVRELCLPVSVPSHIAELRYLDVDVGESWCFRLLPSRPAALPPWLRTPSVYHSEADEIRSNPSLLARTYDYSGAESWSAVGLQVLTASGWRPDCAAGKALNVGRMLPPRGCTHPFIVEPSELMCYEEAEEHEGCRRRGEDPSSGICVTTAVFFQEGAGASCTVIKGEDGLPRTQGWIVGRDPGINPPVFLQECGLLHALLVVEQMIIEENVTPPFFYVKAGTWRMTQALQKWFNSGHMGLQSAAASDIIEVIYRLAKLLPSPVIITPMPDDFFDQVQPRGMEDSDLLAASAARLYEYVLPLALEKWGTQIARIPWTDEETKTFCKQKYRADETVAIQMLMGEGSYASSIYMGLSLTRSIIKAAFTRLQNQRRGQTVLASIICATRFKLFSEEQAHATVKCMRCGGSDSFEHLVACCGWKNVPRMESVDSLLEFLVLLTREAERGAPLLPIRSPMPELDEISLMGWSAESAQQPEDVLSSLDSLSFEEEMGMSVPEWMTE